MGRKNSTHSNHQDCQCDDEELTVEQQVENKIKQLPTLKEKVHAIAVNNYMLEKRKLDKDLGSEMTKVEIQFRKRYAPLLQEINNIVSGTHTYSDADFQNNAIFNEEQSGLKHNYYKNEQFSQFWFKAIISSDVVGEQVREIDQPLIKHLTKIQALKQTQNNLKIIFTFSQNQWFTNQTLTKQFQLEGDEIKRSFGGQVNWKEGKNITVKTVKKKSKGKKKTTQKQVESFFNFFKEIDMTEDDQAQEKQQDNVNEEQQDSQIAKLERQYEIANELYENLVPRSLQYFLGVVGADFGDLDGLDAIGQQQDDEQQEETKPKKKSNKGGKRKGSAASSGADQ